jgi:hypothetical protein
LRGSLKVVLRISKVSPPEFEFNQSRKRLVQHVVKLVNSKETYTSRSRHSTNTVLKI